MKMKIYYTLEILMRFIKIKWYGENILPLTRITPFGMEVYNNRIITVHHLQDKKKERKKENEKRV